ncbi:MAG: AI-2E family transporter, partial [Flavobacteriales bacterium]|nr:AI-2E family transporter [Flavobacteriales bacterium]
PVVIIMYSTGQNWEGTIMLIYGLVVVGSTDNIFRVVIQKRLADIHPLITLIGVIIGIPIFGFMGLIFGPLLISMFLLVLRIYKKEFGKPQVEEN